MLEVVKLNKHYPKGVTALRDVSFRLGTGERLVIAGPSGCGKTTLLRILAGLEAASSGLIRRGDTEVAALQPVIPDLALVFQDQNLYPHLTVRSNLAFTLQNLRTPKAEIERRVSEAASLTRIAELLDRLPDSLSSGQRQRAALAKAIARRPALLLLDEPLANLDPALRRDLRAELLLLQQQLGFTLIHVTHDQEEALAIGSRLIVMRDGCIQQDDTPLGIYDHPANRFVAEFIGQPRMNFIDGEVVASNGTHAVFASPVGASCSLPFAAPLGRAVLAIRPEAITIGSDSTPCSLILNATVAAVERLGPSSTLHLVVAPATRLTCIAPGRVPLAPGQAVTVTIDTAGASLFDVTPEGRNLRLRPAGEGTFSPP